MSATVRSAVELMRRLQSAGYSADEAAQAVTARAGAIYTATIEDVEKAILANSPPARRVSPETQARIDRHNSRVAKGPPWRAEVAEGGW